MAVIVLIPFASVLVHRDPLKELGIRLDNLHASARDVGLFALLAGTGIVGLGMALGAQPRWPDLTRIHRYPLWALLQQFALQSFAFRRTRETIREPTVAAAVTAGLFAAAHYPNTPLVLATLFGGFMFCTLFARQPNLFTLALCHALLAGLILAMWPAGEMRNLRIGPGYWR
jgi:membrane protease YdiL (CAAX protease family)